MDSWICQTAAVSPAEPGGFPCLANDALFDASHPKYTTALKSAMPTNIMATLFSIQLVSVSFKRRKSAAPFFGVGWICLVRCFLP